VGEDNVDVRLFQALEGALETLNDVLAGETAGVGLLAACAKEDLGCEDISESVSWLAKKENAIWECLLVSGPVELLEGSAHLDLRFTVGVDLGSVKGVDTMIPGLLKDLLNNITLLCSTFHLLVVLRNVEVCQDLTVCQPATKTEDTDLETSRSQVAEQHVLGVVGRFNRHFGCIFEGIYKEFK
jgi:hypothetical protein